MVMDPFAGFDDAEAPSTHRQNYITGNGEHEFKVLHCRKHESQNPSKKGKVSFIAELSVVKSTVYETGDTRTFMIDPEGGFPNKPNMSILRAFLAAGFKKDFEDTSRKDLNSAMDLGALEGATVKCNSSFNKNESYTNLVWYS